jgi:hypothetical protein
MEVIGAILARVDHRRNSTDVPADKRLEQASLNMVLDQSFHIELIRDGPPMGITYGPSEKV